MLMKAQCLWGAQIRQSKGTLFIFNSFSIVLIATIYNSSYEVIQPPVADLIPRPRVSRGQPLTEIEWQAYFDDEGRIENSQEIRSKIFRGVTEIIKNGIF